MQVCKLITFENQYPHVLQNDYNYWLENNKVFVEETHVTYKDRDGKLCLFVFYEDLESAQSNR